MENITITIPDNLTPQQELLAISKQLGKKLLPTGNNPILIGEGYEIKNLQTRITIKRESVEKPLVIISCSLCSLSVEQKLSKKLWSNYGGNIKKLHFCDDNCRDTVLQISGTGRCAIKKSDLGLLRTF